MKTPYLAYGGGFSRNSSSSPAARSVIYLKRTGSHTLDRRTSMNLLCARFFRPCFCRDFASARMLERSQKSGGSHSRSSRFLTCNIKHRACMECPSMTRMCSPRFDWIVSHIYLRPARRFFVVFSLASAADSWKVLLAMFVHSTRTYAMTRLERDIFRFHSGKYCAED